MFFLLNKLFFTNPPEKEELKILSSFLIVFVSAFLIYLFANYQLISYLSVKEIKNNLADISSKVMADFDYVDGKWNTQKYLSDVTTPSDIPLYIFSLDGFLIDRNNIISGLLDTSNFSYAYSFITPKTIESPIGEDWRVYSYPIMRDEQIKGVILIAFFDPRKLSVEEIDPILFKTAHSLDEKIIVIGNSVDASKVRHNEVDPDISFEIVDAFNRSIMSVGGPPAYIDKSYIQDVLSGRDYSVISDKKTREQYIMYAKQIRFDDKPVGIIVLGKGLNQVNQFLKYQLFLSLVATVITIALFSIFLFFIYRHDMSEIIQEKVIKLSKPSLVIPQKLHFDEIQSKIVVNDSQFIDIPKDSYQHDICKLFFRHSSKKYDTFDLSDAIGERDETKNIKRMVYDAVEAINDRTKKIIGLKLIFLETKQYFINPELASKIS